MSTKKPLGLIAGSGNLPNCLIKEALVKGNNLYIVKLSGSDFNLLNNNLNNTFDFQPIVKIIECEIGEVSKIVDFFKQNNVKDLLLAGSIVRPNFFKLKVDKLGAKLLAKIGLKAIKGDNDILSAVESFVQSQGFQLIKPNQFLQLKPIHSIIKPSNDQLNFIKWATDLLKVLSPFDLAQSCVVLNNQILGIENINGTDSLIEDVGNYLQKTEQKGAILVKFSKIGQINTIDAPTIGPKTLDILYKYNFAGLAIDHQNTQIVDLEVFCKTLNDYQLFLWDLKKLSNELLQR